MLECVRIVAERSDKMKYTESTTVELKQILVDDIKKEIVALANTDGGTVYIGVADNGEIVGVNDPPEIMLSVNNMIRDAIKPDLTFFVSCKEVDEAGRKIVAVEVQRGTQRPYYLSGKGLRPEGVYVRQGASSVPATDTAIRRMIRETDGENYEDLRSLKQELSFAAAEGQFAKSSVEFGEKQKMTLGVINEDRIYTNLALLLSDQCGHTIKAAVFQGVSQEEFKDRREFGGSLFKQLNDVYDYIDFRNQTHSTFDKLERIDIRDYPETAIREALLNSIVHREYAIGGSILVKIFSDRMEFISVGGLVRGIEIEDIMSGFSVCRNPKLAAVFYRLKLIEAYGTGIQKIFASYSESRAKPKLEVTPNVFKLTLPNVNFNRVKVKGDLSEEILKLIKESAGIGRKDIEKTLGISQSYAGSILRKLVESGAVKKRGKGRNVVYTI